MDYPVYSFLYNIFPRAHWTKSSKKIYPIQFKKFQKIVFKTGGIILKNFGGGGSGDRNFLRRKARILWMVFSLLSLIASFHLESTIVILRFFCCAKSLCFERFFSNHMNW